MSRSLDGMVPISHWSTPRTTILNHLYQNHFVRCLPFSATLKVEAGDSFETFLSIHPPFCLSNYTPLHPRTFWLSVKSGGLLNCGVIKLYRRRNLNNCLLSILSPLPGRAVLPIPIDTPSITATANSGLTEGIRNRYPVGWCVLSCLCFIITGWECLCYRLLSVPVVSRALQKGICYVTDTHTVLFFDQQA
jgi:hypothetical protein